MLKILQARFQYYINHELPNVEDQIANIHWIIEKAREFQRNICFNDYAKAFDCVDHNCGKFSKRWEYQTT